MIGTLLDYESPANARHWGRSVAVLARKGTPVLEKSFFYKKD